MGADFAYYLEIGVLNSPPHLTEIPVCAHDTFFSCQPGCQQACISPITSTKNIGAILMQNEDLNALQITGTPYYESHYHTLSDTMSVTMSQTPLHYIGPKIQ